MFHWRSVFIFSLDDLSIDISAVLKFNTIIVLISIYPFISISIWCILVLLYWVYIYL